MSGYVEGYAEEVQYCPYCGEEISERWANGKHQCGNCGALFYVIGDDDYEKEGENGEEI